MSDEEEPVAIDRTWTLREIARLHRRMVDAVGDAVIVTTEREDGSKLVEIRPKKRSAPPEPPPSIRPRLRHYALASVALATVAVTATALITAVPWLDTSVVSLLARLVTGEPGVLGPTTTGTPARVIESIGIGIFLFVVIFSVTGPRRGKRATGSNPSVRNVDHYAMREEVKYRGGAEYWSWPKRLWVTLRFGLAHLWNLVIPLGAALALALGSLWFLAVYLRTHARTGERAAALQAAAAVHAAYNSLILYVLLPLIAVAGWVAILAGWL